MPEKIWYLHISTDDWHGWTTVHTTEESANLFLRAVQIKDLSKSYTAQSLHEMDDDDLQELWEQECEGLGFYEEADVLSLTTPAEAEEAAKG